MDEQMIELQPCPWCCEEWIKVRSENSACFAAECQGCAAYGPEASTQAEAIAAWNRRAAHSVIAGKVAELEEALRFAHDTLVEQRVARIIRTDLRAGGLADMISALVNKARAALAPYPERRSE